MHLSFPSVVTALAMIATVSGTRPAFADDEGCSEARRPMVCELEIRVSSDGRSFRAERDTRSGLRIRPGADLWIEIVGIDQDRRDFPRDRLYVGIDADRDFDRDFRIEREAGDRFRISASDRARSGRLTFWLPGNLNVVSTVEIDADSRDVRSGRRDDDRRDERRTLMDSRRAEFICQGLYRGILGREADPEGGRAGTDEIQRGRIEELIASMTKSAEFHKSRSRLGADRLLDELYRGLLDRPVDDGGLRTYRQDMQKARYSKVILTIIDSPEYRKRIDAHDRR